MKRDVQSPRMPWHDPLVYQLGFWWIVLRQVRVDERGFVRDAWSGMHLDPEEAARLGPGVEMAARSRGLIARRWQKERRCEWWRGRP